MDYNVPGGKLNRGMAVYDVLAAIKDSQVQRHLAKNTCTGRLQVHNRWHTN